MHLALADLSVQAKLKVLACFMDIYAGSWDMWNETVCFLCAGAPR